MKVVQSAKLVEACEKLRGEAHDPFRLERHDYAAPGSYLPDLVKWLLEHARATVTIEELVEWGGSQEQTALYDAVRAFLCARGGEATSHTASELSIEEGGVRVFIGDLDVADDVRNAGALIVAGNLTVGGVLRCAGEDANSGILHVTGNVHARGCHLMGPASIIGDVVASHLVYAAYYDDGGALWIGGRLATPLYALNGDRKPLVRKLDSKRVSVKALHKRFPAYFDDDGDETNLDGFIDEVCSTK